MTTYICSTCNKVAIAPRKIQPCLHLICMPCFISLEDCECPVCKGVIHDTAHDKATELVSRHKLGDNAYNAQLASLFDDIAQAKLMELSPLDLARWTTVDDVVLE